MAKSQQQKAEVFMALHQRAGCFVIPNPWDAGTARLLAGLGFEALATTSAGLAFSLGRPDGEGALGREEVLANARDIVGATELPVSADLEDGFAERPEGVEETIRLAAEAGLVGGSIEDASVADDARIYEFGDCDLDVPNGRCYVRSVAISELGRVLNPSPGRRVIAVLYAYLDTSYNAPPKGVTSVAGYVAPLEEWISVEGRWETALVKWNLDAFHFSSLSRDVGRTNVSACEGDFAEIINTSDVYAVGAALVNADWTRKDWGEDAPTRLPSRYEQCLDMALRQVGACSKRHFPE
jgi:hypothetical protein